MKVGGSIYANFDFLPLASKYSSNLFHLACLGNVLQNFHFKTVAFIPTTNDCWFVKEGV